MAAHQPQRPILFDLEPWHARYELVPDEIGEPQLLGSGSFGNVYLGREIGMPRRVPAPGLVALKFVNSQKFRNKMELTRVREEVRIHRKATALAYPHTVVAGGSTVPVGGARVLLLYSAHEEVSAATATASESLTITMAMELAGRPLVDVVRERLTYSEETARNAVMQIGGALNVLHTAAPNGIVHRDLKLDNILCTVGATPGDEALVLCDLGLSFEPGHDTRFGEIGTLNYVPPEVVLRAFGANTANAPDVELCPRHAVLETFASSLKHENYPYSDKTDVWALGGLLFTFLSGHAPFEAGPSEAPRKSTLRRRIWHGDIQWPPLYQGAAETWARVSPAAKNLITSIFVHDPANRPTMSQVLSHAWFRGPVPIEPLGDVVRASLGRVAARARWQRAVRKLTTTLAFCKEAKRGVALRGVFTGLPIDVNALAAAFKKAAEMSANLGGGRYGSGRGIVTIGSDIAAAAATAGGVNSLLAPPPQPPTQSVPTNMYGRILDPNTPQSSAPRPRGLSAGANYLALANPSMSITLAGLRSVLVDGANLNPERVDALLNTHNLFEALDIDKSGRIDWREFLAMLPLLIGSPTPLRELPDATLALYVSLWDADGDGRLRKEELASMLYALGIATGGEGEEDRTTSEALGALVAAADDGVLDWQRLRAILSQDQLGKHLGSAAVGSLNLPGKISTTTK